MDKYEYNLKLEEIDKLVDQGDYEEAANLADTIDWKRVRNVRTLCLISEIYEAAGRLEDSKVLLVRAYRRSPVGRTVLYRLVEVTTALGQYDEAIEFYSEYIQAAPHDNNRYILKYMIYRGRGSSAEELIEILEEYLGQEYTERWAYELAKLYQQTGQMQKCFATCDDLVLWFHSGKYVKKALELKKRYTSLTVKQQQIYDECLQEEEQELYEEPMPEPEEPTPNAGTPEGEMLAESIMAQTEKQIAGEVTARKAQMEQEDTDVPKPVTEQEKIGETKVFEPIKEIQAPDTEETDETAAEQEVLGRAVAAEEIGVDPVAEKTSQALKFAVQSVVDRAEEAEAAAAKETEAIEEAVSEAAEEAEAVVPAEAETIAEAVPEETEEAEEAETEAIETAVPEEAETLEEVASDVEETPVLETPDVQTATQDSETVARDFQVGLAKSMREIISGVVRRPEEEEEDIQTSAVDSRIRRVQKLQMPETKGPTAGKLSIDDILLSMGDKGKQIAEDMKQRELEAKKAAEEAARKAEEERKAAEEATRLAAEEAARLEAAAAEERERGLSVTEAAADELTEVQKEALTYTSHPEKLLRNKRALPTYSEGKPVAEVVGDLGQTRPFANLRDEQKEVMPEADIPEISAEKTIRIPVEKVAAMRAQMPLEEVEAPAEELAEEYPEEYIEEYPEEYPEEAEPDEGYQELVEEVLETPEDELPLEEGAEEISEEEPMPEENFNEEEYAEEDEDRLYIPDHLRGLFKGFSEIRDLEDQIANAIIQAESKGSDRTSRSGNILIFGAHGSGKTTLAVNLAKAIAQDKGSQVMKMAKIYATDLNRKDIAATIAKIAGGTLIIEEAGDLEDKTVDQLTTAMEFRTDGLIVILEDEQQYIHELLMRHPRFTMKFTAQIYIPIYTAEELAIFGQNYAREQDFVISEEAIETLQSKISARAADGTAVAVTDVIEMVNKAMQKSNRFFRKIGMGKKRYDENDYVVLFPKDFK